ncbi:MAG: DedA family protein [Planctomycetota bacterium]
MLEELIENAAAKTPYLIFVAIFLATGFGLPLPEDIPLIVAGYICGVAEGYHPNLSIMIPVCFLSIVGSDCILYVLGRRYGHHMLEWRFVHRIISRKRLYKAEAQIQEHGGKFVFVARFLPGIRAPAFFAAGVFKVPFTRFVAYDGLAATVSVPTIILLAYWFAEELDAVKEYVRQGKAVAIVAVVLVVACVVGFKVWSYRRTSRLDNDEPDPPA